MGRKRSSAALRMASRRRQMLVALGRDGEVHHHDAVLLDDADQQDDADHGDQAEIEAEQHQRGDRAGARGGQGRQDRQRVDVALVEDAEDQVDHEQGRQDQHRHGAQRGLEGLGVALEGADQRRRHPHLALGLLDGLGGGAERSALRQVEADGDGRELPLVADRQRLGLARRPLGEGRERHLLARGRGADVDLVQAVHLALQLGQDLHHHVVAVLLGEVLRHLALAEGVVERVVDHLRREAVAGGLVAVDGRASAPCPRSAGRSPRRAASAAT